SMIDSSISNIQFFGDRGVMLNSPPCYRPHATMRNGNSDWLKRCRINNTESCVTGLSQKFPVVFLGLMPNKAT
ncbi:MAG TPA: hypothetical protein VEC35_20905, partial [Noviherbaspirillum sp.]|nr:hypothetical protein [Noviherbaspirillum sp.]